MSINLTSSSRESRKHYVNKEKEEYTLFDLFEALTVSILPASLPSMAGHITRNPKIKPEKPEPEPEKPELEKPEQNFG